MTGVESGGPFGKAYVADPIAFGVYSTIDKLRNVRPARGGDDIETNRMQSVRSFAEQYAEAWCSQDAASVAAFFDEQGSLTVNEDAPAVGREAITSVAQGFMTAFPDMQVLLDDVQLRNDGASFHWTLVGTNTGPGGTGRGVRISGFEVWQFGANGLIAKSEGHFDNEEYSRQLGV